MTPGATLREAASGVYKSGNPPNALAPVACGTLVEHWLTFDFLLWQDDTSSQVEGT
ncbi:hypothetical protein [Brasilonema bromeliae]|uniref:hypothetical protein n=1 Tax=Brasilonema bromeliae TaxID=383615 RepID=UPI00145F3344